MYSCMRTTIDMPDALLERVRAVLARRRMTFRALVIDALEQAISEDSSGFRLRDASAGYETAGEQRVSVDAVNRAIDEQRDDRSGR